MKPKHPIIYILIIFYLFSNHPALLFAKPEKAKALKKAPSIFHYGLNNKDILQSIETQLSNRSSRKKQLRILWLIDNSPQLGSILPELKTQSLVWLASHKKDHWEMSVLSYDKDESLHAFNNFSSKFKILKQAWTDLAKKTPKAPTYKNTQKVLCKAIKKFASPRQDLAIILITADNGSTGSSQKQLSECLKRLKTSKTRLFAISNQTFFQDPFWPLYQRWIDVSKSELRLQSLETPFRSSQHSIFLSPGAANMGSGFGYWTLSRLVQQSGGQYYFGHFYDPEQGNPFENEAFSILPPNSYNPTLLEALEPSYDNPKATLQQWKKDPVHQLLHNIYKNLPTFFNLPEAKLGKTLYDKEVIQPGKNYYDWEENPIAELLQKGSRSKKDLKKHGNNLQKALATLDQAETLLFDKAEVQARSQANLLLCRLQLMVSLINVHEMNAWLDDPKLKPKGNRKLVYDPISLYDWLEHPNFFEPQNKENRDRLSQLRIAFEHLQKDWANSPIETAAYSLALAEPRLEKKNYEKDFEPKDYIALLRYLRDSKKPRTVTSYNNDPEIAEANQNSSPPTIPNISTSNICPITGAPLPPTVQEPAPSWTRTPQKTAREQIDVISPRPRPIRGSLLRQGIPNLPLPTTPPPPKPLKKQNSGTDQGDNPSSPQQQEPEK